MRYLPELFENNRRWVEQRESEDHGFFRRLSDQQNPDLLWIGCADSRVPANEIVGLDPGELFVHRNIANVVPAADVNCASVVQYAVDVLAVEHIIVCGHYGCGGVQAALESDDPPTPLGEWLGHIRTVRNAHDHELQAIADPGRRARRLCELNVQAQLASVARLPMVTAAWARDQPLVLHGWIYELSDGLLHDLDISVAGPE